MITVHDLSFSYSKRSKIVLDHVNLDLSSGEIGVLLGRNGAGKTTLFSLLSGQRKYVSGSIKINDVELSSLSKRERAKLIAYVPQLSSIEALSVYDTIMLGRLPYYTFAPKEQDKEIVAEILEELDLTPLAFSSINEISGGERQKAIIGIALAQQSKCIILDEPANNLDIKAEADLFDILQKLAKTKQIAILFSTHDIALGYRFADKFFLMHEDGHILSGGKELLDSERLSDIYGRDIQVTKHLDEIIVDYRRQAK